MTDSETLGVCVPQIPRTNGMLVAMTDPYDAHLLSCGCLVWTPHPDLMADGRRRLAQVERHPMCDRHSPTAVTGSFIGPGDVDDDD